MSKSSTIDIQFKLDAPPRPRGRKKGLPKAPPSRRIPRLTRLLALAIKFEGLIRRGTVRDYAVAVGTAIADRSPHRSVRAELPHTAPA